MHRDDPLVSCLAVLVARLFPLPCAPAAVYLLLASGQTTDAAQGLAVSTTAAAPLTCGLRLCRCKACGEALGCTMAACPRRTGRLWRFCSVLATCG